MAKSKIKITSIETDKLDTGLEPLKLNQLDTKKPDPVRAQSPKPTVNAPSALNYNSVENAPSFGWVKVVTILAILAWLLIGAGLLFGVLKMSSTWQSYSALQWGIIACLLLGPALLIGVAGYSLKQLARISKLAYDLNKSAHALTTPDKSVIGKSQSMAMAIGEQVDEVNEKLNAAVGRLASMDEAVKSQTHALDAANLSSRATVDKINTSVNTQTQALSDMGVAVDANMESIGNTLTMHTDNLAKSVQIAEQKIKEARISVEGATAKINNASDIVRSNTVQASATLSASHEDIKSLGDIIRLRSDELDDIYKKHAGELTAMIEHLRDEQTSLGASMEQRLIKMRDLSLSAQASAESLSKASSSGKETIEALASAASLADGAVKTRFSEMRDMVKYSTEHAKSISDMAATRVQDSLEMTRKEIHRIEEEMAELQARIGEQKPAPSELFKPEPSLEEPHNSIEEPKTPIPVPEPKPKKTKRSKFRFSPIADIEPETEFTPAQKSEQILQKDPNLDIPDIVLEVPKEAPQNALLNLKRSMVELDAITQKVPPLDSALSSAPATIDDRLVLPAPKVKPQLSPQIQSSEIQPSPRPLQEAITRAAPLDTPKKPKANGGLFGGLFRGRSKENGTSALDIVGAPRQNSSPTPLKTSPPPTDDDIILADLAQLGLGANAVVDDDCITQATNARMTSGHEAMSRYVGERLKNPVVHLVKSLAVNDDLSDKVIIFATRFDRTIEMLSGNRDAIQIRLETEKGRAYLLCDAALNYGRV